MNRICSKIGVVAAALSLHAGGAFADEILVGAEIPLTGSLARVGAGMHEGISVAVEVFNKTNGKHTIKIVTADDESAPAKAIAAVEKLAGDGVVAITGGYGSNNIGPASDAANKLGLPYITSGGVAENLTERGYKTFFRINNTAGYQKAMVGLLETMKVKSASVVYSTKEATADLAKDVEKELAAKGVAVTLHAFDPAITDFKPIINKVRLQDKPEVIVMVGYENDYVGILRAAKVLKPTVKAMVGVWSLATPKMASDFPDLMPAVYGTALLPFPAEFQSEEDKRFIAQLLLDQGQYEHCLTLLGSLDSSAAYLLDYEKLLDQLLRDQRHDLAQELLANATGSTHSILLEHYLDWHARRGDTQQAQKLLDKETPRLEPATLNWLLLNLAQRHFQSQPYWTADLLRQSDRLVSSRKGQPEWPFMRLLHLQHLLKEQAGRALSQRDSWTVRNHLEEIAKLHAQLEFDDALSERIHHCELLQALGESEQARTLAQEIERQLRDAQFPEEDDQGFYCDEFVTVMIRLGALDTARKLLEEGLASDWQEEPLLQAHVEADRLEEAVELISFKTLIGHADAPINALHQRILSLAEQDKQRSQRLQQRLLERLDDDKTWKTWGLISQGQRNETLCAI